MSAQRRSPRSPFVAGLALVFALAFAVIAGCSGDPEDLVVCEPACEVGVCTDGQCLNPETCGDEAGSCLDGFSCVEGACEAGIACSPSAPCVRGTCEAGACVNAEVCADNGACLEGFKCDGGTCAEALCEGVTCDRGVCDVSTGACVNMGACSPLNEQKACLGGYRCYDGQCATDEEICADVACTRGVCDVVNRSCVDAETCASEMECLTGDLCIEGSCVPNVCDSQSVTCERGVCDPISAACVNADTCTDASACTDGFFCVGDECVARDVACGACPGNQSCDYDGVTTVACAESAEGCRNAFDCVDERVCRDGACAEAPACEPDAHEPNDTSAVAYHTLEKLGGAVQATLCEGDVDAYAYDLREDDAFIGTLVVELALNRADIGLGEVTVELVDPDGSVTETATSTGGGIVRLESAIGAVEANSVFEIRVRAAGELNVAGLRYGLFVQLVEPTVAAACAAAEELIPGVEITANTVSADSTTLGSNCVVQGGGPEQVYTLEILERSFVVVGVTPSDASLNLTLGLRAQCASDESEIGCADEVGAGITERVQLTLDPGLYYVVVQGPSQGVAGPYGVFAEVDPVICDFSDDACADSATSRMCNSRGTGFDTIACDMGCDASSGRCIRAEADVCYAAIEATGGYTGTIEWNLLRNDYDPGESGCVPTVGGFFASRDTEGPDAAFRVELAAGEAAHVEVSRTSSSVQGHALYVVSDCDDLLNSCIKGINATAGDSREQLIYSNRTMVSETVYIVVDSEVGTSGDSDITITTGPVICQTGEMRCTGADLETCNSAGIGWDAKACTFGCDSATLACVPAANTSCAGAIDASLGGSHTGNVEDFTADYDPGVDGCVEASGREGVYVINAAPGDVVRANVQAAFDASLYAITDCAAIADSCLRGADQQNAGGAEAITVRVPDSGTLYLVVDSDNLSETGAFTLDVTVETPSCTPFNATCLNGVLDYCDAYGTQVVGYTCSSNACAPSGTACAAPDGDLCPEAIDATAGGTFTGSYDANSNDYDPGTDGCTNGFPAAGPDTAYFVDLQPGVRLSAALDPASADASLYVVTDCGDITGSCLDGSDSGDPERVSYRNNQDVVERVFVIADSYQGFGTPSGAFTLNITLGQTLCSPNTTTCNAAGDAIETCNADGTAITQSPCDFQGCTTGSDVCTGAYAGDTCGEPVDATGGGRFAGSFADFNPDYDPGSAGCTAPWAQSGPDAAYWVPLAGGETLTATVTSSGSDNPSLYVVSDCADVALSCLVGSDSGGTSESVTYTSNLGEVVYVIVDSFSTSLSGDFIVDIEVN